MAASQHLRRDLAIAAVSLVVLLLLPVVIDSVALRDFLVFVAAYGLLALSLNLLIGYTGLISLGHGVFFGLGAYAFGLMMQSGAFSIPAAFVLGVLFVAVVAAVIGIICVRLKEIYFAFLTLAFQMLIYSLILAWVGLTGGDQGLMGGIPRPPFLGIDLGNPVALYVFTMVVFVVCVLIMRQLVMSPFGYTLRMIRDNQQRAIFLGVEVVRVKLLCFVLASCMAGVGGILLALFVSGAYPNFAYWTTSGEAIFMIMLGGTNVFLGPLAGTLILTALNDLVTVYTEYYGLVLGLIILVFVLGLRHGLLDFLWEMRQRRRHSGAERTPAGVREAEADERR